MNDPQILLSACCMKGLTVPAMHRKKLLFVFICQIHISIKFQRKNIIETHNRKNKDRLRVKQTGGQGQAD